MSDGRRCPKAILTWQIEILLHEIAVSMADWMDTPAWRIFKRKRLVNEVERLQEQVEQTFESLNALD